MGLGSGLGLGLGLELANPNPNPPPNQAASVLFALARAPLALPGALVAWTAFTSVHLARLLTFTRRLHLRLHLQQEQRMAARRSD